MRKSFGEALMRLAAKDSRVVLLTCDVQQEMREFKAKYPERFFDLGLTEQATIGVAAGMAAEGLRPIVYSLTPFVLERPFEAIKVDIDEQNLPVILIGYAGYPTHGPTHRPLDPEGTCKLFKNVRGFFPTSHEKAVAAILDAYLEGGPAFVSLYREGQPIL